MPIFPPNGISCRGGDGDAGTIESGWRRRKTGGAGEPVRTARAAGGGGPGGVAGGAPSAPGGESAAPGGRPADADAGGFFPLAPVGPLRAAARGAGTVPSGPVTGPGPGAAGAAGGGPGAGRCSPAGTAGRRGDGPGGGGAVPPGGTAGHLGPQRGRGAGLLAAVGIWHTRPARRGVGPGGGLLSARGERTGGPDPGALRLRAGAGRAEALRPRSGRGGQGKPASAGRPVGGGALAERGPKNYLTAGNGHSIMTHNASLCPNAFLYCIV